MEGGLIGFGNSLEWIFSEIRTLTAGQSVSQVDLEKGGIEIWPSVDLGYCGPEIYEEVIRPNLSKRSWKNISRNALGLVGESAAEYLLQHQSTFSQFPDSSQASSDYFELSVHRIAKVYWNRLLKINPNLSNQRINTFSETVEEFREDLTDNDCQSALLFLFIRNPSISKRVLKSLCTTRNICSKISLAKAFLDLESNSVLRNTNVAINFLLEKYLELTDSVGMNGINHPEEVQKVNEILKNLGYLDGDFVVNDGEVDWSPLNEFINTIEAGSSSSFGGIVSPGSLVHLWLCSSNAPRKVIMNSQHLVTQSAAVTHWSKQIFLMLEKKERLRAIRSFNEGGQYDVANFGIYDLSSLGMQFKLKLPSNDSSECVDCNNPNFDCNKMIEICKNLFKSPYINGSNSLSLSHSGLIDQGYVNDGGQIDHLLVNLVLPSLQSPEKLFPQPDESDEQSATTSEQSEQQSNVEILFDYYSNIIQSRTSEIIDFVSLEKLHLLGITGWTNHEFAINEKNRYNDSIIALWKDANGDKIVKYYKATTSPGTFQKFYNKNGDAHLMDGRYAYKRGKHNGYNALVQADKFTVWRDKNKDGIRESDSVVETGYFGINLHAGGTTESVGNWSAGCQVIWGGRSQDSPFDKFMQDVENLLSVESIVYYTLVNSINLPSINDYVTSTGGE